ncbi:MAG: glutamate racemase [Actinomycetota bacterium]|nr:glutamate racemase [Actinomycetota bacterium]
MAAPEASLPIAVFDSGVGGLTVLHELLVSLPHEDFTYLGDTARFPYGERSPDELESFATELAGRLLDDGAKLLVVACNSATAAALPALRATAARVPVIAVVEPDARLAGQVTQNGRVGLLATAATVASGAYAGALERHAPEATLHPVACPELAPLIQAGDEINARVVNLIREYCAPLRRAEVDTVILGCTHYPLVRPMLQRELGRGVMLVSSAEAVADAVERELEAGGLGAPEDRRGTYRFMCSGDPDEFRRVGTRFLQLPMEHIHHIDVARVPA